jgi:hypothetical protein
MKLKGDEADRDVDTNCCTPYSTEVYTVAFCQRPRLADCIRLSLFSRTADERHEYETAERMISATMGDAQGRKFETGFLPF